mgnify:CR=1 FL=1
MSGAVAIWHDLAQEGLDEFYAWHGQEHMPERVGIPGFVCGRRFKARQADLQFFNLYETQSLDVVLGNDYKTRLDHPTPRTLSAVRHFRHVARSLCRVVSKQSSSESGIGQGGLIATLRYDVDQSLEPAHLKIFQESIVPKLVSSPGICSVSLLVADRVASGYVNAEQRARGASNSAPPIVLLVEAWGDEESFNQTIQPILNPNQLAQYALSGTSNLGLYAHQLTLLK